MQKVALVTGSSRGIGAACAKLLARDGYRIALHYVNSEEKAQKLSSEIPNSKAFRSDLAQEKACAELFNNVKSEFGRVDVLVNNAGMSIDQVITFAKPDDFDKLIATNLKPVFLLSKLVSKQMIKQKSGNIINLTSVVGHTGNPGQSMYATTKGAITAFTKSIAADLAPFGIRCNCVAPGFIGTDMTSALSPEVQAAILAKVPLRRLGTVEEIAEAVCFLASEKSSYITGSTIHVNGGMYTT